MTDTQETSDIYILIDEQRRVWRMCLLLECTLFNLNCFLINMMMVLPSANNKNHSTVETRERERE